MSFERVTFQCHDIEIKGKVYRPEVLDDCKGIVIFTHGLGYCDRQYEIDGDQFAAKGYILFVYNLRGHAGTSGEWTLNAAIADLSAIIDFLTHHYVFPNNLRICAMGHSTGALITLFAAAKDPRIRLVSAVTVVTRLRDSYLHWFESGFNIESQDFFKAKGVLDPKIKEFLDQLEPYEQFEKKQLDLSTLEIPHRYGLLKSKSWSKFFHEIVFTESIIEHADELKIPVLLFRGESDEVMDVKKTNELYDKLKGRLLCKLFVTGSLNHFHNDRWGLIQQETLRFFDEHCGYSDSSNEAEKHILIIDDDPLVTRSLQILLQKSGFEHVHICNDGETALKSMLEFKEKMGRCFNLVISDIRMPGIDGVETIRRAKKIVAERNEAASPVIFITGYEGDAGKERASEVGYMDYFYKPLDLNKFVESVRRHLGCIKKS